MLRICTIYTCCRCVHCICGVFTLEVCMDGFMFLLISSLCCCCCGSCFVFFLISSFLVRRGRSCRWCVLGCDFRLSILFGIFLHFVWWLTGRSRSRSSSSSSYLTCSLFTFFSFFRFFCRLVAIRCWSCLLCSRSRSSSSAHFLSIISISSIIISLLLHCID